VGFVFCVAIQCRDETEQTGNSTLVYGEITFKTLALALHKVKTKYGLPGVGSSGPAGVLQGAGGTFYDIGSGTGKPVWVKCMLWSWPQLYGSFCTECIIFFRRYDCCFPCPFPAKKRLRSKNKQRGYHGQFRALLFCFWVSFASVSAIFGWRAQVIAAAILHPFRKAVGIEVRQAGSRLDEERSGVQRCWRGFAASPQRARVAR